MELRTVIGLMAVSVSQAHAQPVFAPVTDIEALNKYQASSGDVHGPGGVFADLNNDGYPDLYLPRATNTIGSPKSNLLLLNVPARLGGRTFETASHTTGAADPGNATGAIAADYDNDGDKDIYVLNYDDMNVLYQNELAETGELGFKNVTLLTDPTLNVPDEQMGVGAAIYDGIFLDNTLTAAWGDVNRDGYLDLWSGNHNGPTGIIEGPFDVPGRRDVLYLNNGDGTFTDVTEQAGTPGFETENGEHVTVNQNYSSTDAGMFVDVNNDLWPDLMVVNKVGGGTDRDMLYINKGQDESGEWLGFELVTYSLDPVFGKKSPAAMGVDAADFDNDGDMDLYLTDWSNPLDTSKPGRNVLYQNEWTAGNGLKFLPTDDWNAPWDAPAKFSWGVQFIDADNDGRQDLHVVTHKGFTDIFYHNRPVGWVEISADAGIDQLANARGDMSADFDRDGRVDLFVINVDGDPSVLYRNETPNAGAFLSIRLIGDPDAQTETGFVSSRDAIGARARVEADLDGNGTIDADETQIRDVTSGGSNAGSTSSLELEFGLGEATTAQVTVFWPSGAVTEATTYDVNQFITITEACFADQNGDGELNIFDFISFQTAFQSGDLDADCNTDGGLDVFDFICFQSSFTAGCR